MTKPLRADAQRNRDAILAVARSRIAEQGVSTSLEAIAREAGVGVGTLYRHFPDRDHLLVAALNAQAEELREVAETASGEGALDAWLAALEAYLSSYQGLPDSLAHALAVDKGPLAMTCQEIVKSSERVLVQARERGEVRPGVTAQDVFEAALMTAWLSTQRPGGVDSARELLRRGMMRPGSGSE